MKFDKTRWTGSELFEFYTSGLEYSEYAQDLLTAESIIGDTLFSMLEKAEKEGKKIVLEESSKTGTMDPIINVKIA